MLEDKEKTISLAGFKVEFSDEQLALMDEIKKMYDKAGVETIKNENIYEFVGDKNIASAIQTELASQGEIFKLDASYYIDTNAWDVAVAAGRELGTEKPEGFTLAEYRDKLEISRKFASVLLSALDKYGITVFNGECRKAIK